MVTPGGPPLDPSNLISFIIFVFALGVWGLGNILASIVKFVFWEPDCIRRYDNFWVPFSPKLTKLYTRIDDFFRSRPPGHLQGGCFVGSYCHVGDKFEFVFSTYGEWDLRGERYTGCCRPLDSRSGGRAGEDVTFCCITFLYFFRMLTICCWNF